MGGKGLRLASLLPALWEAALLSMFTFSKASHIPY